MNCNKRVVRRIDSGIDSALKKSGELTTPKKIDSLQLYRSVTLTHLQPVSPQSAGLLLLRAAFPTAQRPIDPTGPT